MSFSSFLTLKSCVLDVTWEKKGNFAWCAGQVQASYRPDGLSFHCELLFLGINHSCTFVLSFSCDRPEL